MRSQLVSQTSGRQRHHDRLPRKSYRPCTAATVYVCEGEKTADAARSLGLVVVTSMNGALSPDKTDWMPLAGKIVVILPDHDEPGRKYAKAVAAILAKLSPAPVVKIVELPGLTDGDDLVEWIAAHGDEREHVKAVDVWKRSKGVGEPPTSPDEPVAERYLADDTTVESLAGLLWERPSRCRAGSVAKPNASTRCSPNQTATANGGSSSSGSTARAILSQPETCRWGHVGSARPPKLPNWLSTIW